MGAPVLLLVDDEERILTALRRCLRREGYELLTASGPQQALRILRERKVDGVVSDQMMPGMSGIELLAEVRKSQPGAARILCTGWVQAVPDEALDAIGLSALIVKPWDDAELKRALRSAVGGSAR